MTGTIRVDLSQWPIALHISEGSPSDAQLDQYMREASEMLQRKEPHVVVMDSTRLERASAYARVAKKEWLREHEGLLRAHCLGTAVVLRSSILRFISGTLMAVRPMPTPYFVCETVEEAMAWARERLRAASDDSARVTR